MPHLPLHISYLPHDFGHDMPTAPSFLQRLYFAGQIAHYVLHACLYHPSVNLFTWFTHLDLLAFISS